MGKYTPNLARFYFKPTDDWSRVEALDRYEASRGDGGTDKVYYEDCIEGMKRLAESSVDLVVADPPFGIDFSGAESFYNRKSENVISGYKDICANRYDAFSHEWIESISRVLKETGSAFIFSGWTRLRSILNGINSSGMHVRNHVIWRYPFGVYAKVRFVTSHYHVIHAYKGKDDIYFNTISHYEPDVWEIKRRYMKGQKKNGTKLPIEIVQKCINFCSRPGDCILDPFMGNGTTACASKGELRHYIGYEINKNMKPIIEANIEKIETGSLYMPYTERLPSVAELAKEYPRAYKAYKKKEGL